MILWLHAFPHDLILLTIPPLHLWRRHHEVSSHGHAAADCITRIHHLGRTLQFSWSKFSVSLATHLHIHCQLELRFDDRIDFWVCSKSINLRSGSLKALNAIQRFTQLVPFNKEQASCIVGVHFWTGNLNTYMHHNPCLHVMSTTIGCTSNLRHHIAGEGSLVGDFVDPQLGYYGGEKLIRSFTVIDLIALVTILFLRLCKIYFFLTILVVPLPIGYPVLVLRVERGVRFSTSVPSLAQVWLISSIANLLLLGTYPSFLLNILT